MFDFILQLIAGHSLVATAANLFWPFVSIPDLFKISVLLIVVVLIELWVRKRKNGCRRDA